MTNLEDRFTNLEAVVSAQRAALATQQEEIAVLQGQLAQRSPATSPTERSQARPSVVEEGAPALDGSTPNDAASTGPAPEPIATSRRKWLQGGAIAAGAAVVGATAAPHSAAAADGSNMVIGANNTSEGGNTRLNGNGTAVYSNRNILTVSDKSSTSTFEAAIGAYGEGDVVYNGLYAYSGERVDGDTTTGFAVVAAAPGARAHLLLNPAGSNPNNDSYSHRRGAVRFDTSGNLWVCTATGTPGRWRMLAGNSSAGAVHAISPARAYDSRFDDGPLGAGFNRVVSVADRIDVETGVIAGLDVVPDGATAVFFNIAVTETVGGGYAFVGPGTATTVTAATINWSTSGQTVANGTFTSLDDDRNLRVFVGGASASTHFIIDITGYTL